MSSDTTSSGPTTWSCVPVEPTTSEAIFEIRRRSGLTWDQLSEIFTVPRRKIHQWANGKSPSIQQESEIRSTLTVIRHLDEGDSHATRARLLEVTNGQAPIELISKRCYAEVLRQDAGTGMANASHRQTALSEDEWERRKPTPPVLLLDAIADRPKTPVGKVRILRPVRINQPT